jgi:hypothetical protein
LPLYNIFNLKSIKEIGAKDPWLKSRKKECFRLRKILGSKAEKKSALGGLDEKIIGQ